MHRDFSRTATTCCVALLAALATSDALAQDLDERARIHFESASLHFETGDYESALREFEAAHRLSDRPALLYNLYLCHERLGHLGEAADHLARFLAATENVEDRRLLELRLENLRRRAAGTSADTDANTDTDTASTDSTTDTADTDSTTDAADAADSTAHAADADTEPNGHATSSGPSLPAILSFSAAGVGAALWATFGILAISEDSRLDTRCRDTTMPACDGATVDDLRTFNLVADIGFGVTLLGAALGVLFLLLDGGDDSTETASARLTPFAAPHGAGLSIAGRL